MTGDVNATVHCCGCDLSSCEGIEDHAGEADRLRKGIREVESILMDSPLTPVQRIVRAAQIIAAMSGPDR